MTNYYVATTGNNTDPGTLAKPWETLKYAESQLSSGDVVSVRGGVYEEYFTINVNNVTFQNYPGESPIVDGAYVTPAIDKYVTMIMIESDDVTVDGLTVKNSACYGIYINKTDNVTIKNVEVYETYRQCLVVTNEANNALIEDCNFHHGAKVFVLWDQRISRQDPPIVTVKYSNYPIFRRTKIHDSYNEGINIGVSTKNAIVEHCEIYGNPKCQLYLCASTNNIIRYNLIYGTNYGSGQGIYFSHEDQWVVIVGNPLVSNSKVYGNLVANTSNNVWIAGNINRQVTNVQVYNNTFVEAKEYGFRTEGGTGGGHLFKNNIIWQVGGQISNIPLGKVDCDYNLWSRTPDPDSQGVNDPAYALPQLAKTIGWNDLTGGELDGSEFILQPTSPAIDAGIDVGLLFVGLAPDIGAIEYGLAPDLCEDVVCEDVCIGVDLYSQKCDPATGNCITDQLIESNSLSCGYVPPDLCEDVVCEDVFIGVDLYSQKCDPATGNCITDQLIESNSLSCGYVPPDELPETPINIYIIIGGAAFVLLALNARK